MSRCYVVVLIALSLVVARAEVAAAQHYVVTDLGALSGQPNSQAFGVNSSGAVTGFSYTTIGTGPSDDPRAFVWTSAGGMQNIGNLFSYTNKTYAVGINEGGQVAGLSVPPVPPAHGFLYSGGTMTDLQNATGALSTTNNDMPCAINNSGWVTGAYYGVQQAFLYYNNGSAWTSIDLGSLGGPRTEAYAINNDGVVVGESSWAGIDPTSRAFVWTLSGGMQQLLTGAAASTICVAYGINDNAYGAEVVGRTGSGNFGYEAFLATHDANGVYTATPLGFLTGSTNSTALAINNSGQVVGWGDTTTNVYRHAFLYTAAGGMQDLNGLIAPNSGWTLEEATAISNGTTTSTSGGYIAGYGLIGGYTHAFRLTPAISGDANLDGKVDINDLTIVLTNYNQTRHGLGHGRLQRRRQGQYQ